MPVAIDRIAEWIGERLLFGESIYDRNEQLIISSNVRRMVMNCITEKSPRQFIVLGW